MATSNAAAEQVVGREVQLTGHSGVRTVRGSAVVEDLRRAPSRNRDRLTFGKEVGIPLGPPSQQLGRAHRGASVSQLCRRAQRWMPSASRAAEPALINTEVDQLVDTTYTEFAHWLHRRTGLTADQADALTAVGLGALFSARLLRLLLGRDPVDIPDDTFVATWVQTPHTQIEQGSNRRA